jgi:hypothetical protein
MSTGMPTQLPQPAPATPKPINPALKQALMAKMAQPSVETKSPTVDQDALAQQQYEAGKVNPWLAFASGIGQTLQGKSPDLSWQDQQNKLVYDKTLGKLALSKKDAETKRQFDEELKFKNKSLMEQIAARKDIAQMAQNQQKATNQTKQQQTMLEIEDRRQNINANIKQLQDMVATNGTYELFGSQNQDMDRLLEQIATDMAKLQDPNSVARPSEVEAVKKSLIKPGFNNSNSTALDILNNFSNEVNRRADSAYKIRGLDAPQGRPTAQEGAAAPSPVDGKIEKFMQKNGISDRNEAIRILKEHGKL